MPISTVNSNAKPIIIPKDIKLAHNARSKNNNWHITLLKPGFVTLPISQSDLSIWMNICEEAEGYHEDNMNGAEVEAVRRFRKELVDAPVLEEPLADKLDRLRTSLKAEILGELASQIGAILTRLESLEDATKDMFSHTQRMEKTIVRLESHLLSHEVEENERQDADKPVGPPISGNDNGTPTIDGAQNGEAGGGTQPNKELNAEFQQVGISKKDRQALTTRLDNLAMRFGEFSNRFDRNDEKINIISGRLNHVETKVATNLNAISNLNGKLWDQACRVSGLQEVCSQQDLKVEALEENWEDANKKLGAVDKLNERSKFLEEKIASLSQGVKSLHEGTHKCG